MKKPYCNSISALVDHPDRLNPPAQAEHSCPAQGVIGKDEKDVRFYISARSGSFNGPNEFA
jgi:hypothetical protein